MTAVHRRAARREAQLALTLRTTRVRRAVGEAAPDVPPVERNGVRVQFECKSRLRPLATVARWLAQCEGYAAAGAACALAVFAKGQRREDALVVLRLGDFERLLRGDHG